MSWAIYKNTYSSKNTFVKTKITIHYKEKCCEVDAFWDTGASISHISKRLADLLELVPCGEVTIHGHRTSEKANKYITTLVLPTGGYVHDVPLVYGVYENYGFDIIIGMDIIKTGVFHIDYTGDRPVFTFKHPSEEDIFIETELF